MEIKVSEQLLRVVIVNPQGQFDMFHAPTVQEQFQKLLDDNVVNFVVDLSSTLFLDSAAMAVLISLLKQARHRQGKVVLVWPEREAARRLLTMIRFDCVFEMVDTVEAGLSRFHL